MNSESAFVKDWSKDSMNQNHLRANSLHEAYVIWWAHFREKNTWLGIKVRCKIECLFSRRKDITTKYWSLENWGHLRKFTNRACIEMVPGGNLTTPLYPEYTITPYNFQNWQSHRNEWPCHLSPRSFSECLCLRYLFKMGMCPELTSITELELAHVLGSGMSTSAHATRRTVPQTIIKYLRSRTTYAPMLLSLHIQVPFAYY